MIGKNLQQHFMAHPLLAYWLSAIGCQVEDIEQVSIAHDIERDKEREEKHDDGWKHWKYGKEVTFTITMKSGWIHCRSFDRAAFYGTTGEQHGMGNSTKSGQGSHLVNNQ